MRVLMLGWEFPPHISGGLGTACFGLTRGLARNDVAVTFVVPRSHGDEHARHIDLIGASDVLPARSPARPPAIPAPVAMRERESASTADDPAGALQRAFELIEIDSPLRPYLTEARYAERLDAVGGARVASATRTNGTSGNGDAGAAGRRCAEREATAWWSDLSGTYGPDLIAEVRRYAAAVAEVARRTRFDVIHAHDWMTYPAGLLARELTGRPLVAHVHASEYDRSGENVDTRIRDLEATGITAADRVVCVSRYTADLVERRYGAESRRLRVVHNAIDREPKPPVAPRRPVAVPVVLFLGRVTFQKGPDYFLSAARRVVDVEPNVKFVMSGSGDMLPRMVEYVAELGLARHVHFTGFVRGENVDRLYRSADLYVMPSVSEPFGIAPLEALARETPVVVSRQSGVAELLTHALKVDFWDVDGLANAILAVLRHRALRRSLAERGRDEVARLSWDRSGAQVRSVYEELTA